MKEGRIYPGFEPVVHFDVDSRRGTSPMDQEKTQEELLRIREFAAELSLNPHSQYGNRQLRTLLPLIGSVGAFADISPSDRQDLFINAIYLKAKGLNPENIHQLPSKNNTARVLNLPEARVVEAIQRPDFDTEFYEMWEEYDVYSRKYRSSLEKNLIILRSLRVGDEPLTIKQITDITKSSKATVKSAISELLTAGVIEPTKRKLPYDDKIRNYLEQGWSIHEVADALTIPYQQAETIVNRLRRKGVEIYNSSTVAQYQKHLAELVANLQQQGSNLKDIVREVAQFITDKSRPFERVNLTELSRIIGASDQHLIRLLEDLEQEGIHILRTHTARPRQKQEELKAQLLEFLQNLYAEDPNRTVNITHIARQFEKGGEYIRNLYLELEREGFTLPKRLSRGQH